MTSIVFQMHKISIFGNAVQFVTTMVPIHLLILFVFAILTQSNASENNGNKLSDVLKNQTNAMKNQTEEDNILKHESHKLLSACGMDGSDDNSKDEDSDSYNNRRGHKNGNGNNYDSSGGRRNSYNQNNNNRDSGRYKNGNRGNNRPYGDGNSDSDDSNNDGYGTNGNRRKNGNRYNNQNYETESEDSNQSDGYDSGKRYNRTNLNRNNGNNKYNMGDSNRDDCRRQDHGYDNSNNRNHQWTPYGNNGGHDNNYDRNSGDYGSGYYGSNNGNTQRRITDSRKSFEANPFRVKRSNFGNNDEDDTQCISQCVFGYLEVLDDNRSPSETLVIKWLQDHLSTNDMKRIRALREARRCFAKLSSETEDGCEFSKNLSKCLNLELEK